MRVALFSVIAPGTEPLTLAEVKAQSRITTTDEDTLVTSLITAARVHVETLTRRALITQTWDYKLRCFPNWALELPMPPLQSVGSINYLEAAAGASTLLATSEYRTAGLTGHSPGRVTPEYGKVWPVTYDVEEAVTVRFTAGYGAASAVPQPLKQAMLLLIAAWYENREAFAMATREQAVEIPGQAALDRLLRPYVVEYFGGGY